MHICIYSVTHTCMACVSHRPSDALKMALDYRTHLHHIDSFFSPDLAHWHSGNGCGNGSATAVASHGHCGPSNCEGIYLALPYSDSASPAQDDVGRCEAPNRLLTASMQEATELGENISRGLHTDQPLGLKLILREDSRA